MIRDQITTDELAAQLGVKAQTIRAALCRQGHYYGLQPTKMPNRFLLWPSDAKQRLAAQPRTSSGALTEGAR